MSEPFLSELWAEKARKERGEKTFQEKVLDTYFEIKSIIEKSGDPKLIDQLENFKKAVLRYAETIVNLSQARLGEDIEEIESSDMSRRIAHNRLESDVNILARWCARANLDTSWRDKIGLTRDEIGSWAWALAPFLKNEILKKAAA